MNKDFQYFNNREKYRGICVPSKKEEIFNNNNNCLIKDNFLSEFSTNEEKQKVLQNLGILQKISELLEIINNKVSQEDLYNLQNPLKLTLNISSTLLEYTGDPYQIRINAQAKKGDSNVDADTYQISFNSTTESFNKIYETTVTDRGITTFNVTCTLGEEVASGKVQVNVVFPTYIGFFNSDNFQEVNTTSFIKIVKDSIQTNATVENTISGSYLWIISPYTLNYVATDPGFTYKVEMVLEGTSGGLKYYKSNSAIDVSNLTYYIK